MKVISRGQLLLEIDDKQLDVAAEDEVVWRREMLKYNIEQTVLLRESCTDHREFRSILIRALCILSAISAAVGIPLGVALL